MKPLITIIGVLLIALTVVNFQCNDDIVEPPPGNPPGYQEDIPWPSLADSPWPMNHHDPQSTGRSKFVGPKQGILAGKISAFQLANSVVIGINSEIYMVEAPNLGRIKAVYIDGTILWSIVDAGYTTPLVGADGTIYAASYFKKIYAFNPDGTIKWTYNNDVNVKNKGLTIDIEGRLYFIEGDRTLKAINSANGELIWKYQDERMYSSEPVMPIFSPDGKTLYLQGFDVSLLAFDIESRLIKWTFGDKPLYSHPLVDADGNIYIFPGGYPLYGDIFYCLRNDGSIRWTYKIDFWGAINIEPTMDKNGNIFFASDTLYSLNYLGEIRWKYGFDESEVISTPLICDNEGNIFFGTEISWGDLRVRGFTNDGTPLFSVPITDEALLGASPVISRNGELLVPTWNSDNLLIIR